MSDRPDAEPGNQDSGGPIEVKSRDAEVDQTEPVRFDITNAELASNQIWQYGGSADVACENIVADVKRVLSSPDDFPPLASAIVPGDRVALAVDPNVPNLPDVLQGVLENLRQTAAESIEIVLWDEATEETVDHVRRVAGEIAVVRHRPSVRDELCYLAADVDADPIYLNRSLVDADFVLPIVAARFPHRHAQLDITGIFPSLTDSATRTRYEKSLAAGQPNRRFMKSGNTITQEVPWLLGVLVALCVRATAQGEAGEIFAGTIDSIGKRSLGSPASAHNNTSSETTRDEIPEPADLVIASLDGDRQQQTWENVVRASEAATGHAQTDATIVIWSGLAESPGGLLWMLDSDSEIFGEPDDDASDPLESWDRFGSLASRLRQVQQSYRVMLHSRLSRDAVEQMGLGVVESARELSRLSRGFESCTVLRAASFAGGSMAPQQGSNRELEND